MSIVTNTKLRDAISKAVMAYQEETAVLIQNIEVQWDQDMANDGAQHTVHAVVLGVEAEGKLA